MATEATNRTGPGSPLAEEELSQAATTVARALADQFGVECTWEQMGTNEGNHHFLGVTTKNGTPIGLTMNVTP